MIKGFHFASFIKHQSIVIETLMRLSQKFDYPFFSKEDMATVVLCHMSNINFTFAERSIDCLQTPNYLAICSE